MNGIFYEVLILIKRKNIIVYFLKHKNGIYINNGSEPPEYKMY